MAMRWAAAVMVAKLATGEIEKEMKSRRVPPPRWAGRMAKPAPSG
jgi:hypothetical protein